MDILFVGLFFLLPISSIGLMFLKDSHSLRKIILNILLLGNALFFLSPIIYAYLDTPSGGNMWSENEAGAALWMYFIVLPLTLVVQLILMILKIIFSVKSKANN